MSTNQYQEMRNRQQAEVNAFPMFFAFNKQQFAEGMRKLGQSPSDTRQVCRIFGGGYCRKSDVAKLNEMFTRHRKELEDAIAGDKTGQGLFRLISSTDQKEGPIGGLNQQPPQLSCRRRAFH